MSPKKRRRGPGEGSIEKVTLKSGRTAWRGWVTVGYRTDERGVKRAIRRSVQHRRYDAVVEGMARLRDKYKTGLDLEAETTMRLASLFDRWLAHFIAEYKPKQRTPETYRWAIGHAKAQLGDPLVASVTAVQLHEALKQLSQRLKPKSVNLVRIVLDGAFAHAVYLRVRPDNPADGLRAPRETSTATPPAPRRVLSADEGRAIVEGLQAERNGLAVALTYALGLRPGEAAALRVADFDMDALTVAITGTHNVVNRQIVRELPKSARGVRTLPIPPELVPWVKQRIARLRAERAAMGAKWTAEDEGLLFVRESDGGRLSNHMIYQVARRVAERAGLGVVGPRILRRSLLSLLAGQGVDPKIRAAIGGHTTAITEKHYHEVDQAQVHAAMGRVSSLLPSGLATPPADTEAE